MIELTQENAPSAEQIAKHYAACMDSVALINAGKPTPINGLELMTDEEWADTVARNKEHLTIMLAKDFWTNEDLSPLQAAAEA